MIQDKNTPELPGLVSTRTSGMFSTFHLLDLMGRWGAWIVLLASLLITFNAWYFVRGEAAKRVQARFDFRVKTIETRIYERLLAYEFLLRGGQSLFATSDEVTREDWRTYVTKLQINQYYPGIQGVGFSKQILPSEKEAHLRKIRSEGFPQYTIKPEGDRPEYTSIIFLEPFDWRNRRAFGYDMFSEPTRKEAMIRARDTGIAALSGKVILVQETIKDLQAGFLIYLAIYRKGEPLETPEQRHEALMGYVYSPFRMNDFMKGILKEKEGYVNLRIFDGEKPLKETLLYGSDTTEEPHDALEGHHFATHQSILTYAGHHWLLSFVSSKYFEENIETGSMNFILWLGITISLLLFGMVSSFTKARSQAIALADTTFALEKANTELRKEITERKQIDVELRESENKYRLLFKNMTTAFALHKIILNHKNEPIDYIFIEANKAFEEQTELKRDNFIDKKVTEVLPGIEKDPADWIGKYGKVALTGEEISFDQFSESLSKWYHVLVYSPMKGYFATIFTNITENKQAEERIIASLHEKEILLKEIHHRVKNNLQIISSLLKLQANSIKDERVKESFRESQQRIVAMASVHTQLYKSQNFAAISFADYVQDMTRQLLQAYRTGTAAIDLIINIEEIMLPLDSAIPCGLLINELITNALKYAFPEARKGEITIEARQTENGVRLIFADNGIGLPNGVDFHTTETLGLRLVQMLVKQLDGSIELSSESGTRYMIQFKPATNQEIVHV